MPLKAYSSFVPSNFNSIPLVDYLLKRFPYHTDFEWSELINSGNVLVNGKNVHSKEPLASGDEISYTPIENAIKEPSINRKYSIIFECDDFLVVDKPPNIPVHPAGRYRTHTLLNLLEEERGKGSLFPVHRLDRETSGVMIFAKSKAYHLKLQTIFEKRLVSKSYLTFVYGVFPEFLFADGFIGKDPDSEIRKKQKFFKKPIPESKACETSFQRISYSVSTNISYVLAKPVTGRIHQIRATLFSLGFPVVGDKLYGTGESAFLDFVHHGESESLSLSVGHHRQALHSCELSYDDTDSNNQYSFKSPLAADLCHLIS